MVEVMMGLAVLAVGGAAIVALLKFTTLASLDSKHMTNAAAVMSSFTERFATEALMWNDVDNSDPDFDDMPLIGDIIRDQKPAAPPDTPGPWRWPGDNANLAATTIDGRPATFTNDVAYCTHVRALWLSRPNPTIPGVSGDAGDIVRIEVRTFWARSGRPIDSECQNFDPSADFGPAGTGFFDDPTFVLNVDSVDRTRSEYGVVQTATILRRNTL
jgi:hypothetical protein